MNPNISITRKGPGAKQVQARLNAVAQLEVLVGIPQAKTTRRGDKINNASLLYIHTHGSPANRIPARPVIEPAIEADGNKQAISAQLKGAAGSVLQDDPQGAKDKLRLAGQEGANASIRWFTDARNNWAPNRPSTVRRKGSNRPLIDTGALRRAITYVVRP